MKRWKLALGSLITSAIVVFGIYTWYNNPQRIERAALDDYILGKNTESLQQLTRLDEKLSSAKLALLTSYPLRESGRIGRSTQKLLLGLSYYPNIESIEKNEEKELVLELALNLALNGYLTATPSSFDEGIRIAQITAPQNSWVALFKMIQAATEERWDDVYVWMEKQGERRPLSKWMELPFQRTFTQHWEKFVLARAYIENGQTIMAREILEKAANANNREEENEIRYLYGLSYLVDAQDRPDNVAMGYYKLAYSYLKELPLQLPEFARQNSRVSQIFANQALKYLSEDKMENFGFFIDSLSHWHADASLQPLAESYVNWLATEQSEAVFPFMDKPELKVEKLNKNPKWQEYIQEALLSRLQDALNHDRWEKAQQFWTLSQTSTSVGAVFEKKVALKIQEHIYDNFLETVRLATQTGNRETVEKRVQDLSHYFSLLSQALDNPVQMQAFFLKLAEQTSILISGQFLSPLCEPIINLLIEENSTQDSFQVKGIIKDKLTKRFTQARNMQDIATMALIFDISYRLKLDVIPDYPAERIANMIADAQYLIESGRDDEAQEHLNWILKISPNNQEALLLLGNSLFASGQYAQAQSILQTIDNPSVVLKQMLAICYLQMDRPPQALEIVERLKNEGVRISDRLNLELGVYQAEQGDWKSALAWWQGIRGKNDQVLTYMFVASFRLQDFEKTWALYNELPSSIRYSTEITSLATRALSKIQLITMAESVLKRALENVQTPPTLPSELQGFMMKFTSNNERDLSLTAAEFYQTAQYDPIKAIDFLNQTHQENWRISTQKAICYIELKDYERATKELSSIQVAMDREYELYWLTRCQLDMVKGDFEKSLSLSEEIKKTMGNSMALARLRAKLYATLWRMPNALQALKEVSSFETMELNDQLLYLHIMSMMGEQEKTLDMIEGIPQRSLSAKGIWQMARDTWTSFVHHGLSPMLPSFNTFSELDSSDKGSAISYLMEAGYLSRAFAWAKDHQESLRNSTNGCLSLAQVALHELRFNDVSKHIQYALSQHSFTVNEVEKAASIAAELPSTDLSHEIWNHFRALTPDLYKEMNWDSRLKANSAALHYFKNKLRIESILAENEVDEIELILSYVDQRDFYDLYMGIGRWHAFLAHSFLSQPAKAEKALTFLQSQCPQLVNIHASLAQILFELRQVELAIKQVELGMHYFPHDARLWELSSAILIHKYNYDKTYEMKESFFDTVMTKLKRAHELAPYRVGPYLLMAKVDMKQDNYSKAYSEIKSALSIQPGQNEAMNLLVVALKKRIETEGMHIEWQEELDDIQMQISKDVR